MRPLFHPPIEDVTVEGILHALSDPVRVAIFADIATANCTFNCSNFLNVSDRPIPKSTLSHHFKALREAGLIRAERSGVEMHNTSRCPEIETRFPGLLAAILNAHKAQLESAKGTGKKKPARKVKLAGVERSGV
jgi:DNA-binding transcriptional ArsR family regulator